jgi:hypothetical protein
VLRKTINFRILASELKIQPAVAVIHIVLLYGNCHMAAADITGQVLRNE